MTGVVKNPQIKDNRLEELGSILDRGIDDMEAGRGLPIELAFQKITELRDVRRNERV